MIKELLAELNTLLVARGETPLKVWKASRSTLEARLDKMKGINPDETMREKKKDKVVGRMLEKVLKSLPTKENKKKAVKRRVVEGGIGISELAEQLGISDKVARAKLRRLKIPKVNGHYDITQDQVDDIKKVLAVDKRRKE